MTFSQADDHISINKNLILTSVNNIGLNNDMCRLYYSLGSGNNIFWMHNQHETNPIIRFRLGTAGGTSIIMSLTDTSIGCSRDVAIDTSYKFATNTMDTNGNNDLVFNRNSVEYMRFDGANSIINVGSTIGVLTGDLYTNNHRPRSNNTNTIWYGRGTDGISQVEIFRYDYSGEELNFNTIINNTGINIIGNIIDTTVSDDY